MRHYFTYLLFVSLLCCCYQHIKLFLYIFELSDNSYKFAFSCKILHKRHVLNMFVPNKLIL